MRKVGNKCDWNNRSKRKGGGGMFWSGFIVGSAVGIIGITLYSCLVVASRADCDLEDEYEYEILKSSSDHERKGM